MTDWKNAEVFPIPKKGDMQCCDNWRGISLLDVVGKVFARIFKRGCKWLLRDYCQNPSVASGREGGV